MLDIICMYWEEKMTCMVKKDFLGFSIYRILFLRSLVENVSSTYFLNIFEVLVPN